ncbi:MAG: MobH family relaxase [Pseudomonadota bacterium]
MLRLNLRRDPPPGLSLVDSAQGLLDPHRALLSNIQSTIGVPEKHWKLLYLPVFTAFAEFVQTLPASEAHHHCDEGGHLRHSLEVTDIALRNRRGFVLPPGKEVEQVSAEQDVWTYAVATAALLHDIGKPLVDQVITLFGKDSTPLSVWSPWFGTMRQCGGVFYQLQFRRDRDYRLHEAIGPMVASKLMPRDGLRWLNQHPDAMAAWAKAMGCGSAGADVVDEIVTEADGASVALDLAGDRKQVSGARAKPLGDRLVVALRHLLESGELPMNRKGAAAFVTEADIWLVSKRCLDTIRDSMGAQGQSGIPSRNDRLMDELQQRGMLLPNGEDRAVWSATVSVPDGDSDWTQELTLLRMPRDVVWSDPSAVPELLEVSVVADDAPPAQERAEPTLSVESTPAPAAPSGERIEPTYTPPIERADAGAPEATGLESTADEDEEVVELVDIEDGVDFEASAAPAAVADAEPTSAEEPEDLGKQFIAWLVDGIKAGKLAVNTPKAKVHVVEEGLLLVSPAIFKVFASDKWSLAQKRFLKLKLSARTSTGENIFHYDVNGDRGKKTVKGILIDRPEEKLTVALPKPNSVLSKKPE